MPRCKVHHIAGEDCYLVKVRVADPEALGRLLRETFGAIEQVRSTRTTIVLSTIKETSRLPIRDANGTDDGEGPARPRPIAGDEATGGGDA